MVTWPMTSHDPQMSRTTLSFIHHISTTVPDGCMCWDITRQMATSVINHYWNFFLSVPKMGHYFTNFGETISNNDLNANHYSYNIGRVSNRRQVSNTSWKEQKALRRIQEKMMHVRSTLDWSQSNSIFCSI